MTDYHAQYLLERSNAYDAGKLAAANISAVLADCPYGSTLEDRSRNPLARSWCQGFNKIRKEQVTL